MPIAKTRCIAQCVMLIPFGIWGCSENVTPWAPYTLDTQAMCIPNLDEKIESSEFPMLDGVEATYRASTDISLDFAIGSTTTGISVWDFSADIPDDQEYSIAPHSIQNLENAWFATSFPTASWVVANDLQEDSFGLYSIDTNAFWLHGLASTTENDTLLTYENALPLLRFPIQEGDHFVAQSNVEGKSAGLPFTGIHKYDVTVQKTGILWLHNYTFASVWRINTIFQILPPVGNSITVYQSSFFTECFGELVRLQSDINPSDFSFGDFSTNNIANMRRLYLE